MIEQQFTFQCDAADCTEHFTALDVTIHQAITEALNQGWYVMTMAGKPELTGLFVTCPVHNPAAKARKRAEAEARQRSVAARSDQLDAEMKDLFERSAKGFAAAVSIPRCVAVARMAFSQPFEAICGVEGCYHAASQHNPHLGTYRCDAHATVTNP